MIALRDGLPLIVLRDWRAMAFDRDWLVRVLALSAHRAGHADWTLAPHVAESVRVWLGMLQDRATMPVETFMRAVREALKAIGFAEIGACLEAAAPFGRISLVELAQQAGNGFELAFFAALGRRLREIFAEGGSYCELHGLAYCVKILLHRQRRSRAGDALRAEIVAFSRNESARWLGGLATGAASAARELFLYVA